MYEIRISKSGHPPKAVGVAKSRGAADEMVDGLRRRKPSFYVYAIKTGPHGGAVRTNPPEKIPVVIEDTMEEVPPWPV